MYEMLLYEDNMKCEICGQEIDQKEEFVNHRYFGAKHVKCLDRALIELRKEIEEFDREIEN